MDLARSACYLEYAPCRVRCPEHGVRTEAVPWARHGARFTRDFEDWVAWLAVRCTASAVSELARVEWHSVGGVCRRVYAELEAARGASRFDGVRRIGIDETSYKKGHKYVTVVVDHDRGCLIWAHEGTGKDVLNLFLDELTREQRRAIEVVTASGMFIRAFPIREKESAKPYPQQHKTISTTNEKLEASRQGRSWAPAGPQPQHDEEPLFQGGPHAPNGGQEE
jgi:transposase